MRCVLLTIVLALLPLSARAVIPLELVAEFELPENAVAWDVQHWMDEESIGYAYMVGHNVFFARTTDSSIETFILPQALLDSNDWWWPAHQAVHLMRLASRPDSPVIAVSTEVNEGTSDYYRYHLLHVFDLDQEDLIYYYRSITGSFSNSDGWNSNEHTLWLDTYPPPPAFASRLYRQNERYSDFEGPGTDREETTYGARVFDFTQTPVAVGYRTGLFDFIPGTNGDLALLNVKIGETEYGQVYGWSDVGRYDETTGALDSHRVCTWPCLTVRPIVFVSAFDHPSFVCWNVVVDMESLAVVDTLIVGGEFSLRQFPRSQELLWRHNSNGQLVAHEPETRIEDTTSGFIGGRLSTLKGEDGTGLIVAHSLVSDSVRIYKIATKVERLVVQPDVATSSLYLNWSPTPYATSYVVCRSQFAEGDFCEQDEISVADTFITLQMIEGVNREFFRVKAIFD